MLLAMMAARFMHHVSALCARTLETLLADWEISSSAQGTNCKNRACARCMAEQTGVHDVVFHAHARKHVPGHALELIVPVLMLPRACACTEPSTHAPHTRAGGRRRTTSAYFPRRMSSSRPFQLQPCSHHVCPHSVPWTLRPCAPR